MTKKQAQQFNTMLETLRMIGGTHRKITYMSTDQLRKNADDFDSYEDLITMTYENIQSQAKESVRGIRPIVIDQLKAETKNT